MFYVVFRILLKKMCKTLTMFDKNTSDTVNIMNISFKSLSNVNK